MPVGVMTVASPPVVTQPLAATLVSEAMPFPSSPEPLFREPAAVETGQTTATPLSVCRACRGMVLAPVMFPPGGTVQVAGAAEAGTVVRAAVAATAAVAVKALRTIFRMSVLFPFTGWRVFLLVGTLTAFYRKHSSGSAGAEPRKPNRFGLPHKTTQPCRSPH